MLDPILGSIDEYEEDEYVLLSVMDMVAKNKNKVVVENVQNPRRFRLDSRI